MSFHSKRFNSKLIHVMKEMKSYEKSAMELKAVFSPKLVSLLRACTSQTTLLLKTSLSSTEWERWSSKSSVETVILLSTSTLWAKRSQDSGKHRLQSQLQNHSANTLPEKRPRKNQRRKRSSGQAQLHDLFRRDLA